MLLVAAQQQVFFVSLKRKKLSKFNWVFLSSTFLSVLGIFSPTPNFATQIRRSKKFVALPGISAVLLP